MHSLSRCLVSLVVAASSAVACGAAPTDATGSTDPSGAPASDTAVSGGPLEAPPSTLDEARASISALQTRLKADPNDHAAKDAMIALGPRIDELSHVVAQVQTKSGHVIKFYDTGNGSYTVGESGPDGDAPVLTPDVMAHPSLVSLYRTLSEGAEPPAALVDLDTRAYASEIDQRARDIAAAGGQAAPDGARGAVSHEFGPGDGQLFQQEDCFTGGDFHSCQPDWANGGWYRFNAHTSFFRIAAVSGPAPLSISFSDQSTDAGFVVPVYQGTFSGLWAHAPSFPVTQCTWVFICYTADYDYYTDTQFWQIENAAGSEFDWSTEFKWSCTDVTSCNTP
jgi:hypothetical protein